MCSYMYMYMYKVGPTGLATHAKLIILANHSQADKLGMHLYKLWFAVRARESIHASDSDCSLWFSCALQGFMQKFIQILLAAVD